MDSSTEFMSSRSSPKFHSKLACSTMAEASLSTSVPSTPRLPFPSPVIPVCQSHPRPRRVHAAKHPRRVLPAWAAVRRSQASHAAAPPRRSSLAPPLPFRGGLTPPPSRSITPHHAAAAGPCRNCNVYTSASCFMAAAPTYPCMCLLTGSRLGCQLFYRVYKTRWESCKMCTFL